MTKRKILFLIPSLVGGGAERTLINLLNKIDFNIYDITLVSVLKKGHYLNKVPQTVKLITLFNNALLVRTLAFLQKRTGLSLIFKLVVQKKVKEHFDVGISFLDSNFTELLFFLNIKGKKFTWVHSSFVTNNNYSKFYKRKKYCEKLKKRRYDALDGILFVSEDSMSEFISVFGKYPYMKVIYNIINSKEIKEKANEIATRGDRPFTFIAVGSLIPVKNIKRLINASKIVKDLGFSFNVTIVGAGPLESELKSLAKEKGLDEIIHFVGFVDNPYPLIKNADAFVMSSISEALPTVLCEAMILGKPSIVTNCSGCRGLVENGKYGLMAEQDDSDYADKMVQYLTSKALTEYYSSQSLERSKLFNDELTIEQYYEVFNA